MTKASDRLAADATSRRARVRALLFVTAVAMSAATGLGCGRAGPSLTAADDAALVEACLEAYSEGRPHEARRLATGADAAEARLVHALCLLHDPRGGDPRRGLDELHAVWADSAAPEAVRHEAGLSFARSVDLLARRDTSIPWDPAAAAEVFERIMSESTGTRGLDAARFRTEQAVAAFLASGDIASLTKVLSLAEDYAAGYTGPPENAVALHLLLATAHRELTGDYARSLAHLERAHESGIEYGPFLRRAIFQMARICHLGLHRRDDAMHYYDILIERFPLSREATLARRYRDELGSDQGDNHE